MTKRIFRSVLFASAIALLAALLLITGILYRYFSGIQKKSLMTEYDLASSAVEQSGADYLRSLKTDNYRLTWISSDGTVLYDTSADAESMENHAEREEIKEAFENGTGESERYSSTITEKTLYYAGLLSDGTVLRISASHASVLSLMLGMIQPFVIVLIALLLLSVILANRMSKKITEPLNAIDLEHPLDCGVYEELSPLLRKIDQLHGQVGNQIKELKRKTDEFEQIIVNMNEGLVLLDGNGAVISINNAAVGIFGVDKSCVGNDFLTVDRTVETQEAIQTAMSDGHSEIRTERNGCEYQFDISRIESGGNTVGTVLLAFDITEKKFAERNRREFTANVSHELKTPLQSITGSAELIENGLVKPEDMPRFIGHIRTEAARLVTLIEDIIRLSQLDEESEMQREDTDLYSVTSDAINELKYAAAAKNINMTLTGGSVVINGVKKLLYEIVYNLCDNAIKYTNAGNGKYKRSLSRKQRADHRQ